MDLASNYFGEDFWDLATIEYDPVRTGRETQYLITRFAELTPNRRILDLCCGQGRHVADLIKANFEVVGTDTSHRALSVARMAAPAATFHNFDVFAPGWPALSNFGGAMLIQSCGWVSDGLLLAMLRRIRRCLAADGVLVLDVSVSPWIHRNFITEVALESGHRTYRFDRRFDAEASVVVGSLNVSDGAKERQYPHRVRVYDLPAIRQLVTAAQYSVIAIDADFEIGRLPTIDTRYAQLICRPLHVTSSISRWADSQTANPTVALDLTAIPDEPNYAQPSSREAWAETVKCAEDWEVSRAYHADDPFCSRLSADLGRALQVDIRADQVAAGAGITSLLNACARFATGRTLLHGACDHTDLVVWAAPFARGILSLPEVNSTNLRATLTNEQDALVFVQRPPMFGAMMSPAEIDELAAAFPRAQFVIDEAYLNYGEPGCSAAAIAISRDNVLVLCGLSKGYGAGGLRVAFALAAQEMLADLKDWLAPLQISSASALAARSILRRSGGLDTIRVRLRAAKQRIERALTAASIRMLPTDDVAPWICCRPDTESPVGWFASRGVLVRAIQAPDGLPAARLFPPLSDSDIAIFEKRVGE